MVPIYYFIFILREWNKNGEELKNHLFDLPAIIEFVHLHLLTTKITLFLIYVDGDGGDFVKKEKLEKNLDFLNQFIHNIVKKRFFF